MNRLIYILLLLLTFSCNSGHRFLGKEVFKEILKEALENPQEKNTFRIENEFLRDKQSIVKGVEPLLFKGYGKAQILKQKPYELYKIQDHWVIKGTMKKNWFGGTFLIIVNSINGKIIRISHGK